MPRVGVVIRLALPITTAVLCSASSPPEEFQPLVHGLEVFSQGSMMVLRVTPGLRTLMLTAPKDPVTGSSTLPGYLRFEHGIAAISGGFMRSYVPPLPAGLLVVGGRVLNNPAARDSILDAMLVIEPGDSLRIVPRAPGSSDARLCARRTSCLQTGPLLVANGARVPLRLSRRVTSYSTNRSFVARDSASRILLGWTAARSFDSLAADLASRRFCFGIRWAAGLSGDVNCGLLVMGSDTRPLLRGDSTSLLPNALVVR